MNNLPIIFTTLLFSAFFSGMEIAFVSSNKVRLELDLKRRTINGYILRTFYRNKERFISTLLVGNNISLVVYGIAMAKMLEPAIAMLWGNELFVVLMQTIVSTLIILVTAEFLPKTLFRVNPNLWLSLFSIPLLLFYIVLYPVASFTTFLSRALLRMFGIRIVRQSEAGTMSKVDLDFFIQQSIDEAPHSAEVDSEVKIFQNALDFSKLRVRDCMIPRKEIVAVDVDDTEVADLIETFTETGLSKLIVYSENIDNIVGYIHSSELFVDAEAWRNNIKPIYNATESMLAQKLMKNLMQNKMSVAVVIDEFGGTGGIVTMEDLVEEIFGDIEDEHDQNKHTATQVGENEYELSGRLEIEKLNELFDFDFPESDDYQTVAGYILFHYQTIPKVDEEIVLGIYTFTIIENEGSKIGLVRMKIEK